ncbi:FAD/NAD(P)-binding domain-containing protein [Xylona heveae TC161]|uniref:FAD/NAD(P)-binding domain-containing protein n=1 Tax=Xylona heveae (strain CBS 132557 / TC161) TaxID=1328760 RepID=A0A165AIM4_XYLHT|nr:FAD/NAD(P)-binding domain-containing protein [Xylona heveae TC161]KZF20545.1 FAD/NAD(P)-binding domain-containing protein [Xylona heveae TC161]
MASESTQRPFRVVIAGGGIAGLTLANVLQHVNIDYVLLEARPQFVSQAGAAIAIMPNGARILDQLGMWDDILEFTGPVLRANFLKADGSFIVEDDDVMELSAVRHGYGIVFHERQNLLKTLWNHVWDKEKLRLNSCITTVDHRDDGIMVHCKDGSTYEGDIIVGADGVRSIVKEEMWRAAEQAQPGFISEKEKQGLTAEYVCLFGISKTVEGLEDPSKYYCTFDEDRTIITMVGKDKRVYFSVAEKLDRVYQHHEVPRYTSQDVEPYARKHGDLLILKDLPFSKLWENHVMATLTPLEEGLYEHWTWGRFVCIGDSIHKTTHDQGSGGNYSIEGAVALANVLEKLLRENNNGGKSDARTKAGCLPSLAQISAALLEYQEVHQARADYVCQESGKLTRLHSLRSPSDKFVAYYLGPRLGDLLMDRLSETYIGAQRINFLPVPEISLQATMPFNPTMGFGKSESRRRRAFFALPLLVLAVLAYGRRCSSGSVLAVRADSASKLGDVIQSFNFAAEYAVIYTVFLIESARRSNALTLAQSPLFFALAARLAGSGTVIALYFFLFYVFNCPIEKFASLDSRYTNLTYTRTVLFSILFFYSLPYALSVWASHASNVADSVTILLSRIWSLHAFIIAMFQLVCAKTGLVQDTSNHDKLHAPTRDLPVLRRTIGAVSAISCLLYLTGIYTLFAHGTSFQNIGVLLFGPAAQYERAICLVSVFFWFGLVARDLYVAGMLDDVLVPSWLDRAWILLSRLTNANTALLRGPEKLKRQRLRIAREEVRLFIVPLVMVGLLVLAAIVSPGAAIGLAWLYREEVLATRRHASAVTRERLENLESLEKKCVD